MDKAFIMTHFNEPSITQGVDRDEALALAIESEKTWNFTELKGVASCWAVFWNIWTMGTSFYHNWKREKYVGSGYLGKDSPKVTFGHRIAFFLRAYNELYP